MAHADYDEVLDYYPLHKPLAGAEGHSSTVPAFLVGGTPPLSMRYLAHDLRATVEDREEGLQVSVEE